MRKVSIGKCCELGRGCWQRPQGVENQVPRHSLEEEEWRQPCSTAIQLFKSVASKGFREISYFSHVEP